MIDLYDLPRSETETHEVFFDNIMGVCSMVTIMRKDKGPICGSGPLTTAFVAFIDVPIPGDEPRFAWHTNADGLEEKPFSKEWAVEQYKQHRSAVFNTE